MVRERVKIFHGLQDQPEGDVPPPAGPASQGVLAIIHKLSVKIFLVW